MTFNRVNRLQNLWNDFHSKYKPTKNTFWCLYVFTSVFDLVLNVIRKLQRAVCYLFVQLSLCSPFVSIHHISDFNNQTFWCWRHFKSQRRVQHVFASARQNLCCREFWRALTLLNTSLVLQRGLYSSKINLLIGSFQKSWTRATSVFVNEWTENGWWVS